jgi:hypothetical protein
MNSKIIVPILNTEYKVIVCWGDDKHIVKVGKDYGHEVFLDESYRGRHFYTKGCYPLIVLHKPPTTAEFIGTLAHEAVHAVESILSTIGETGAEEILAHSVGAIVRETLLKTKQSNKLKEIKC